MILENIATALSEMKEKETMELTETAINQGLPPEEIVLNGLCAGMEIAGNKYEQREYFVPDMLKASNIFNQAMSKITPLLEREKAEPVASGVVGLVKGTSQDNGKNIVKILLEANGFGVNDLGKSVKTDVFVQAAREGADFIGLSIMTSGGLREAKKVVDALVTNELRSGIKVMVGGAAVEDETQATNAIGADGYAKTAAEAVLLAQEWFPQQEGAK